MTIGDGGGGGYCSNAAASINARDRFGSASSNVLFGFSRVEARPGQPSRQLGHWTFALRNVGRRTVVERVLMLAPHSPIHTATYAM